MTRPRLLLVSPAFHEYWRSIAGALDRRGYDVTTHLYDQTDQFQRMSNKPVRELPERVTGVAKPDTTLAARAVTALDRSAPDVLLVIKGDRLGDEFWSDATKVPRRALWLYDELRRTEHTADTLSAAGPIATYSLDDAAALARLGHQTIHLPLAHDPTISVKPIPGRSVTFVGARYPNREQILNSLQGGGVPVIAYGRDWSAHPLDRLRTWRLRSISVPGERDLSRPQAYGVMAGAPATLNIHGDQDGFTMRTFEAAGVGAVQLIDREDVHPYYVPGQEIVTFASPEECLEVARRAMVDRPWAEALRNAGQRRTLNEHTFDHRIATLEQLWA